MSISAPLPSTAWSAHPLYLTAQLDAFLDGAKATAAASTPLEPTTSSDQSQTSVPHDVFDEIDASTSPWTVEAAAGAGATGRGGDDCSSLPDVSGESTSTGPATVQEDSFFDCALSDYHHILYGRGAVPMPSGGADRSSGMEERGLPSWMKETSGRVTNMASGHLRSDSNSVSTAPTSSSMHSRAARRLRRPSMRLAVGCEDGSVWVFARPPIEESGKKGASAERPVSSDPPSIHTTSTAGLSAPSIAAASVSNAFGGSSRSPSSAQDSLIAEQTISPRPLRAYKSSASLASIASGTSPGGGVRSKRIVSASSAQLSTGRASPIGSRSGASISSLDFGQAPMRARKASATVSISMSPAEPATASHSRARTPVNGTDGTEDSDLARLPTASSPPASPPISPTSGASIPSVIVFPTSPAESSADDPSARRHRRSGSRAKDSIAAGIGLWETDHSSRPSSGDTTPRDDIEVERPLGIEEQIQASADEDEGVILEPIMKISTRGSGPVVQLEVLEGIQCADSTEGSALLVLRENGHLTLVSMLDGRSFGSLDAGSTRASTSQVRDVKFGRLQILLGDHGLLAVCWSLAAPSHHVAVHLNSFSFSEASGARGTSGTSLEDLSRYQADMDADIAFGGRDGALMARWDSNGLQVYRLDATSGPQEVAALIVPDLRHVAFSAEGRHLCAADKAGMAVFELLDSRLRRVAQVDLDRPERVTFVGPSTVIAACAAPDGRRKLQQLRFQPAEAGRAAAAIGGEEPLLDHASRDLKEAYSSIPSSAARTVTCIKQLEEGGILIGYSSGQISEGRVGSALGRHAELNMRAVLTGAITLLEVLELGGRKVIIAGTASGTAGAWDLIGWDCLGTWNLFASPVRHLAYLQSGSDGRPLGNGAVAFISANSPVAFVSLFPPAHLFTLPGTRSSVEVLATSKDEVLIVYRQGLARVCDIASRELRRSMDRKVAETVLSEGGWQIWYRLDKSKRAWPRAASGSEFRLDLREWLEDALRNLPWSERADGNGRTTPEGKGPPEATPASPDSLPTSYKDDVRNQARCYLAVLGDVATFAELQPLMEDLGISAPVARSAVALQSRPSTAWHRLGHGSLWTVSSAVTTARLLQIVCLLRLFLAYPETERPASEAIVFFASALQDSVGEAFKPPSLDLLASHWLDVSVEVHQAARTLFGTYLAATPDDTVQELVSVWADRLPTRPVPEGALHHRADHALLLLGLVATERLVLLSAPLLKEIAASIELYLHDAERPYHQAVATELCSRGFEVWQNYVDAMSLTRQLFAIAIGSNPGTSNDLRNLARNATLHVAGVNTPLLMTTLLFDILNTEDPAARNATLRLLGFLIRKKPLVIYTNLPRVVDAVVKCLDPAVTSLRETVQQAATVILNELVKTYPCVDFHGKSQRIAVGTHEGAAIVYDVKTATRLYVLESHGRAITAVSWSPDGHRLVTTSLDESRIVAWRVSGGLFGMFMPGAPPRAGSSAQASPFKSYDFHVGDESLMTTSAILEWVALDWPAERTVRLRIRETALNFGV
ncbi:hypothetical protein BMF94_6062 [Rhodotorula taiwanensis]|uniref:Uncharacterized protein n=1 Tax=Rhodotorula taiwanensis TaxID=741276 RepID=A0A2S5B296_9BASI|nr:hypothetical protein BMF94_6062 [Rhodotorula taiwanensis]